MAGCFWHTHAQYVSLIETESLRLTTGCQYKSHSLRVSSRSDSGVYHADHTEDQQGTGAEVLGAEN